MMWRRTAVKRLVAGLCAALSIGFAQSVQAPDDEAQISHFETMIQQGRYLEAETPLAEYTSTNAKSWRALYQLGYVEFRLHKFKESVSLLSRSLLIDEQFAYSHKILAFDLNILGRSDLAVGELRRAIALDPNSFECHYELGRILYDRGSYLESVNELRRAMALDPSAVKVYHNLGLAYAAIGEQSKAVENFETALRLNNKQTPRSAWPLIDYGTYFNLQGEFARARDMLKESLTISERWDQAFDELFKAYRGLGQTNLAMDSLKRAIALNPSKAEYHYALARLYSQSNEPAKAKEELTLFELAKRK